METWPNNYRDDESVPFWWTPVFKRREDADRTSGDTSTFKILLSIPILNWTICMRKTHHVIRPYFMNWFNIMDVLWMGCFIIVYVINAMLWLEDNTFINGVDQGRKADKELDGTLDWYTDPSYIVKLAFIRVRMFGFLIFSMWIKMLEHIQLRKDFATAVFVIGAMVMKVLPFIVSFLIILTAFAMYDYIMYGTSYDPVRTVTFSYLNSWKISLGDIDFEASYDNDRSLGVFFAIAASFMLTTLILNLLIAVMSEAYEDVKEIAEANWCYIQFQQILKLERNAKAAARVSPLAQALTERPRR